MTTTDTPNACPHCGAGQLLPDLLSSPAIACDNVATIAINALKTQQQMSTTAGKSP